VEKEKASCTSTTRRKPAVTLEKSAFTGCINPLFLLGGGGQASRKTKGNFPGKWGGVLIGLPRAREVYLPHNELLEKAKNWEIDAEV